MSTPPTQTQKLLAVVAELRRKCPWDKAQTHESLLAYLLEEAYETSEAIREGDFRALKEELGDLLLQVVLHAEIASEAGHFDFEQVAEGIREKMVRRHPHIFSDDPTLDAEAHSRRWTELKQQEKPKRSLLEGTPKSMPALALSQRYGEIAASVGFDWDAANAVFEKVEEEIAELRAELNQPTRASEKVAEELGDVLFALSNLARHLKLSAEETARQAALKFYRRFQAMEARLKQTDGSLPQLSAEQWESQWERAKRDLDSVHFKG